EVRPVVILPVSTGLLEGFASVRGNANTLKLCETEAFRVAIARTCCRPNCVDAGEESVQAGSGARDPAICDPREPGKHCRARGAEIERDTGLLHGLRINRSVDDLMVLPRKIYAVLGPEAAHYPCPFEK